MKTFFKVSLFLVSLLFIAVSCQQKEDTVIMEESIVNTIATTRGNELGCIESCNYSFQNCWGANAQEGESFEEFNDYYKCRCMNNNDDCVWMGSNDSNPAALTCGEMLELIADQHDRCNITYAVCIHGCGVDFGDIDLDDDDNDGIPNSMDPDDDNDGILDIHDNDTRPVGSPSTTQGSTSPNNGSTTTSPNTECVPACPPWERCFRGNCIPQ